MVILAVSLFFGLIAGLCAFLISFGEYEHHFPDSRKTWRIALEFGLVAGLFFTALAVVVFLFFPAMFPLP